jgi:hypothetical protein
MLQSQFQVVDDRQHPAAGPGPFLFLALGRGPSRIAYGSCPTRLRARRHPSSNWAIRAFAFSSASESGSARLAPETARVRCPLRSERACCSDMDVTAR